MTSLQSLPSWFDLQLLELFETKRDRSSIPKVERTLDALLRNTLKLIPLSWISTHKYTWQDIEQLTQDACLAVQASEYKPDVIMGIKSGGAFIAPYVAQCLGVPIVDYMKVSHYSDKSRSVVKSMGEIQKNAFLKEPWSGDISHKIVLLVDDQCATGARLQAASQALYDASAKEVRTLVLFAKNSESVHYFAQKGLAIYFPWGKDA